MATKAQIIAYITSKLTGLGATKTTRAEHENLLYNNVSSVLEGGYATHTNEVSSGTHTITTPNANFTYNVNFSKTFRNVTIGGVITCVNTVGINSNILEIDLSEYDAIASRNNGVMRNNLTNDVVGIYMSSDALKTAGTVVAGESFSFSLTYILLN